MKKIFTFLMVLMAGALLFSSCDRTEVLDEKSIFDDGIAIQKTAFDNWLLKNFVEPYNIDVKYRFEDKESDMSYNVIPADPYKAFVLAKLTKFLWLESYEELVGDDFIRKYCPKVLQLTGSVEYNSSESVVLGLAESGMKAPPSSR